MVKGLFAASIILFSFSAQAKLQIPEDSKVLSSFGECQQDFIPTNFNLFVWNIHKAKDKDAWAKDFDFFAAKSDVVLIQEAMIDSFMPGVALRQKGFCWDFAASFINKEAEQTGVMNGAMVKPLKTQFFRSPGREPVIKTPKMVLVHEFAIANYPSTLLLANIHGLNVVPDRLNQEQVQQIVDFLKTHNGPIIFAGDFNSWNADRIDFLDQILGSIGLKKVTLINDNRRFKLDHIYARGLNIKEAALHDDVNSSDHKPLSAQFSLQ